MFGLYRTFLALLVAFHHLSGIRFQGSTVFCFYMLSGYLMTLIMHDNYGYSLAGIRRFAISRFLKIYPLYWIACLTSIFLIVCLGIHYTKAYHSKIFLPENFTQILRNFFVIFSIQSSPRLVPPTWALTVQFFFYILIASGISKTKKITTIWFLISICYTFYTSIAQLDRIYRFFANLDPSFDIV